VERAAFRLAFPEFRTTSDGLIDAKLAEAAKQINASTWGAKADEGQGLLAAHLLASSPNGLQARTTDKTAPSVYWQPYVELRKQVSSFRRTAGSF
jgi:hypothetical protein